MRLPKSLAAKLLQMCQGEKLPASKLNYPLVRELVDEGIITDHRAGRSKSVLFLPQPEALKTFLLNRYSIDDLEEYILILSGDDLSRSQLVHVGADSKVKQVRTFKGFLVNCYEPIRSTLHEVNFLIDPPAGTYQFIHDYDYFVPHPDVTIVGIENSENFSQIQKQRHLFKNIHPLFVSRYPQHQSKDLIRWLKKIPNPYLHFGDFDFSGIAIYLHEYKRHLGARATWFVPADVEAMLKNRGNKDLYDVQKITFNQHQIEEPAILKMIELLHQYKRGLEQEALIIG
jgi:hypothetical protein